jgi:transcriptional regulatory protein GAL4
MWSSWPGHILFQFPSAQSQPFGNVGKDPTAMNDTRPARTANPRACLQCQKRKTRCIQDPRSASCTYCTRARKECTFEEAPSRTPLTRKNLDALELRCKHLENLVRSLSQGVDIEAQIDEAGERQDTSRPGNDIGDAASEEYEWHESPASTGPKPPHLADSDGMASMAVESSGYLGRYGFRSSLGR